MMEMNDIVVEPMIANVFQCWQTIETMDGNSLIAIVKQMDREMDLESHVLNDSTMFAVHRLLY